MDSAAVDERLVRALDEQGFRFRASDLHKDELSGDSDPLGRAVRAFVATASVASEALGGGVPGLTAPVIDLPEMQRHLDELRSRGLIVCIKYRLNQPVVVGAIEADKLGSGDAQDLAERFSDTLGQLRQYAGTVGMGTRLGATGVLLFIFFDRDTAAAFRQQTQKRCKIRKMFKGTNVVSWAVDVESAALTRHSGIPIIDDASLDSAKLAQRMFAS